MAINAVINAALETVEITGDYPGLNQWAEDQRQKLLSRGFGDPLPSDIAYLVDQLELIAETAEYFDTLGL